MNSLFFIESPLQLLNAYEAESYFTCKKSFYIVRLSNNKQNDEQIEKLIEYLSIREKCFIIKINSKNKNIIDLIKILILKIYFFRIKNIFERFFIGNFESGLFSLLTKKLKKEQIILLDDGSKSIVTQKNFTDDFNFDFFSFYDLIPFKNQNIYKNNFEKLRNKISLKTSTNEILILGSKLSEISIIDEDYYIELIKKISTYFQDKELIYIPHREENKNKLERIKKEIPNIKINYIEYPVEFYGINENKKIKTVISFYSTALYTMSKIYDSEAIAVKFNFEKSEHKINIEEVYNFYEKHMKVVDL